MRHIHKLRLHLLVLQQVVVSWRQRVCPGSMKKLLVHSASQVVTVSSGRGRLCGTAMRHVDVLRAEKGQALSLVVDG